MRELAERRVWLLRRALGLKGIPRAQDVWHLVEFLGGFVRVIHDSPGHAAWCDWMPDGSALLSIPTRSHDMGDARIVLEELAHALLQTRVQMVSGCGRLESWQEMRDEREAQVFCDAWWMPLESVRRLRHEADAEDLLWEVGVSREALWRRVEETRGLRLDWRDAPPWCAWRRYRVLDRDSRCTRFVLVPDGSGLPEIEVPYTAGIRATVLRDLACGLAALRPEEFVLKFREEHVRLPVDVTPIWSEFAASQGWAR